MSIINVLKKHVVNYLKNLKMNLKRNLQKNFKKWKEKIEKFEYDKAMLQNCILEMKKQNLKDQSEMEELEQYGRRQCLKFEGVPTK